MERLERALGRLEAAAARRPRPAPSDGDEAEALLGRHQSLRSKVEVAIDKIDSLLEAAERR